jgi:RecA-family ATPase
VTILSGDGGTGKSTLALQLNVATVIGEPWLGQETRRGRTLYLSAEDDEDELHRRLDAIALHYDVKLADLEDLKIWPLTDAAGALLAEETARDRLQMTALWDELCDLAREWRPVLIVLDSLADVFGGNEISRPQVRQFIGELRCLAAEVGAAVVILAHPSVEGMRSGSGISGSTAWHNSARSRLYLGKPKSDEGGSDPAVRTLSQKKANYAAATGDLRLKLVLGAFNNLDTVGGATVSKAAREAYAEDVFMRLLDRFTRDGRRVGEATSRNYAPAVFASQDEAGEVTKKDLADAMNRLFSRGVIIMIDVGPPSKGTRALVRSNPE